jgi:beta-glucosidase
LSKEKKTLIIGPNAKIAAYHGGGSAALRAYYAVTPFDGISTQLTTPPSYTVGCYAHKELPLLGNILKTAKGEPGVSFRAYNDPPSVNDREIADELVMFKTELLMMDYECSRLKNPMWWADIEGYYVAEEDCDFEFGLGVFGTAKLFVNGELLIDNETKQTKGSMFFDCGTVEEKGIVSMKKGEKYHVKVEFGSAPSSKLDPGASMLFGQGAVRIGGAKVIDAEEEIKHAASLAKDADQVIICAGLNVSFPIWVSDFMTDLISTVRLGRRRLRPRKHGPARPHERPNQRRLHRKPLHSRGNAIRDPRRYALGLPSKSHDPRLVRRQRDWKRHR